MIRGRNRSRDRRGNHRSFCILHNQPCFASLLSPRCRLGLIAARFARLGAVLIILLCQLCGYEQFLKTSEVVGCVSASARNASIL
jgi:hypothetical protein